MFLCVFLCVFLYMCVCACIPVCVPVYVCMCVCKHACAMACTWRSEGNLKPQFSPPCLRQSVCHPEFWAENSAVSAVLCP